MSKILKAILICGYTAVIIQLLRSLLTERTEEIININYRVLKSSELKKLKRELKMHRKNLTQLTQLNLNYKQPERLPTDLKFILKYTETYMHYSSSIFHNGQRAFINGNCSYYNCFLTNDKGLLHDIRNFDAILFDVENTWDIHPLLRSQHQKYIFTASESADYYPVCSNDFDSYYNLTWTYKLDSDIRWTYITILDKNGTVVGPSVNMKWIEHMKPISKEDEKKFAKKKKAASWFVSNCSSKSGREILTKNIEEALSKHGFHVDIYGFCGNFTCLKDDAEYCQDILQQDYYFYLAFENSWCEDYVTEKVLFPLRSNTVPIVFGGADYTRFLPPNSYIDAGKLDVNTVVSRMVEAIYDKNTYYRYFDWHNHYTFEAAPPEADICTLCKLLNEKQEHTVVNNFRQWWYPNYLKVCREELNEHILGSNKKKIRL